MSLDRQWLVHGQNFEQKWKLQAKYILGQFSNTVRIFFNVLCKLRKYYNI